MDTVSSIDVVATVTELFDVITMGDGRLLNAGDVTFGIDEFNCDVLILIAEVG